MFLPKNVLILVRLAVILLSFSESTYSYNNLQNVKERYRRQVDNWLDEVDRDLSKFNSLSAVLTWKLSTVPDETISRRAARLGIARNNWKNKVCESKVKSEWLKSDQRRKLYLFCRGPRFSEELSSEYMNTMGQLAQIYNSKMCFSKENVLQFQSLSTYNITLQYDTIKFNQCVYGEPDLERLIKSQDLTAQQLRWIWLMWHNYVGPPIKELYPLAVDIQNEAAQKNGYNDIGETWREELEMPNLEDTVLRLYSEILPLYKSLHAVVRHKLYEKYGSQEIDLNGPIPIHLLGNMWGQDWSSLIGLLMPSQKKINLEENIVKRNWTVIDMVLKSEDMYNSLGLPRMTEKFWKYSIFEEGHNTSICHGTAANMYTDDDFRILLCAKVTMEDFYVIHHEMGHIQYYMAYAHQPMMFQDGTNSAFHESIGDAIMHAVMVPQHLHRLKLINDVDLFDKNLDLMILLQQGLAKIPEIPFSLIIDKYRWNIFSGKLKPDLYNKKYWDMNLHFRGIVPPKTREEYFFDAAAKFHIPDNTPYIRYFLSSIINMQIFQRLCEISLFGVENTNRENFNMPLHRCDIYGSKQTGKQLLKMMKEGSSQHWSKILKILTGKSSLSAKPLLNYYEPLHNWLLEYIHKFNITVGW